MAQRKDLKTTLAEKIETYLKVDNKEPEWSFEGAMNFLFTTQGEAGRIRAKAYQHKVINGPSFQDEDKLLEQVWSDLSGDGALADSTQLRTRLYQGLQEHFNITQKEFNDSRDALERQSRSHVVYSQFGSAMPAHVTDHEVYREVLSSQVNEILLNLKSRKMTFNGIGDDYL